VAKSLLTIPVRECETPVYTMGGAMASARREPRGLAAGGTLSG